MGAVRRFFLPVLGHPWIAGKLVAIQAEKAFDAWRYPPRRDGMAGKIRQLSLRITDLCNLRCATCGQWGEGGHLLGRDLQKLKTAEVPPERYVELFKDLTRNGHRPVVYLWGGEPMLYRGLLDVVAAATAQRLPVAIATNGTKVAEAAERLVNTPLFLLQISIDGHTAGLHNEMRPSVSGRDNFADVAAALETVGRARREARSRLPLIASLTTISRKNAGHLVDIYDTFRDRVDLFVFYLSWWISPERAADHEREFARRFGPVPQKHRGWIGGWKPENYDLLHGQIQAVLERSRQSGAPPVTLIPHIDSRRGLEDYYTNHALDFGFSRCVSIFHALEVNSNGDVSPCRDYHDYVAGNIRQQTFTEIWNGERYRLFRRSLVQDGLLPVCTRCCGLMGY